MKRFYKKLGMVALVGIAAILTLTGVAHAQTASVPNWYNWTTSPGTSSVMLISVIVNYILSFAVSFGGILINFGLSLDGNVFNSPTVQIGFSVALSIANLGFVLGIIIIAIATILRSETYGIKQVLWKLVAMAILVNFGLVITGPIVGLADNFTGYFLQASGGASNFASTLTTAFAPQGFQGTPQITSQTSTQPPCGIVGIGPGSGFINWLCTKAAGIAAGSDTTGASDFMRAVTSGVFSAVFLGITAFTFIVIGIMLFIRYLYLVFLLILLPLAWLTWIFPKFNHFSKWWGLFIKWTFFPAISLFFIYLATQSVTFVNNQISVPAAQPSAAYANQTAATSPYLAFALQTGQVSWFQTALDELVLAGLCLGGIFAANSLTDKGADSVVHAGKAVGNYAWKKTSGARRSVGDRARSAGRQYNPRTKETTTALQRFGSSLQGIPGLRGAGATLANKSAPAAFHGERKEDIKKYIDENLKNLTNDGLIKRATSKTAFVNPTAAAAIGQEIAKRDLTKNLDLDPIKNDKLMNDYLDVAEKMGSSETILSNRPDLARPRPGETRDEAIARTTTGIKNEEITNINGEALGNAFRLGRVPAPSADHINIVLNLNNRQLGKLGNDGKPEQVESIRTVMTWLDSHGGSAGVLPPAQQRLFTRIKDYINNPNNINWQNIP